MFSVTEQEGTMNIMRVVCRRIILVVLFLCGMQAGSQIAPTVKASNDIAVVVNANNGFNKLSLEDLRKILLGERTFWIGNVRVALVLRQQGVRERDQVLEVLLKMTNADFEKIWQAKMFRGEASAVPLAVPSNGMVNEYVADVPGAISFVVGKNLRSDLKVLKIDGKLPGEPGYLIK
jgi:ABC-type phosphate transport system substrate-binding protein